MKIELDIPDTDIKAQIENKIRDALTSKNAGYVADRHIKERIEAMWPAAVDRIIAQMLDESPKLKASIAAEIEKKLRRKIATLMNAGDAQPAVSSGSATE